MIMKTEVERVLFHAKNTPDRVALCFKEKQMTYGEFGRKVRQAAYQMKQMGIEAKEYVLLSAPSRMEYIIAYLALHFLGAVVVPVNKNSNIDTIAYLCKQFPVKHFLTDDPKMKENKICYSLTGVCKTEEGILPEEELYIPEESNQVSEILFTTGTTGNPKGAVFSYEGIAANTYNTVKGSLMNSEDVLLLPVPLNHSFGLRMMRTALYHGVTIVLQSGFMFTKELETNINRYGCTCLACVPSALQIIYQQAGDHYVDFLGKLRYIEFSTGALDVANRKAICSALPETHIINSWGSTETGGVLFIDVQQEKEYITSAGRAVSGVKIKIVDEQGQEIDSSKEHPGRLAMSGEMLMMQYCNNVQLTEQTIKDGWLYTNDLSYMDKDGYVYLLGRVDDIINVGGEKVAPIEVEKYANEMDGVRDSGCVGVDDPKHILGQVPVIYIVKEDQNLMEEEIQKYFVKCMPNYMIPAYIRFTATIPRNYLGKIDRKKLKEIWNNEQEGMRQDVPTDEKLQNEVVVNMLTRRSVRSFTSQPIEKKYIEQMLQCAVYAPSGHNMQTWQFTVIQEQEKIQNLRAVTQKIAKEKKTSFYGFLNPQVLIVVSNDRRNVCAKQDSACAIENIMLAANSYGMGSCWLNSWIEISDEPEIRSQLTAWKIPETHIVYGIVALGYPNGTVNIPAKKQNVIVYVDGGKE